MAATGTAQQLTLVDFGKEAVERPACDLGDVGHLRGPVDMIELQFLSGTASDTPATKTFAC